MTASDVTLEEIHLRRIEMRGFRRSDGLYEVHGKVLDQKPYDFVPWTGQRFVAAGDPIHDLGVRLVFDADMQVHAVSTFTETAPYAICSEGGRALQTLVGLRMTRGWNKEVRARLSGARSCTHLMELLTPMATVAFQSLSFMSKERGDRRDANGRPLKIDSCYAYGAEREVVMKFWPEFHQPPAEASPQPDAR